MCVVVPGGIEPPLAKPGGSQQKIAPTGAYAWWYRVELNHRPRAYESHALTS